MQDSHFYKLAYDDTIPFGMVSIMRNHCYEAFHTHIENMGLVKFYFVPRSTMGYGHLEAVKSYFMTHNTIPQEFNIKENTYDGERKFGLIEYIKDKRHPQAKIRVVVDLKHSFPFKLDLTPNVGWPKDMQTYNAYEDATINFAE